MTGDGVAYVGAAYVKGQSQPGWIGINVPCSGRSCSVVLSIASTAIAPGQYTSTFTVGTADASGKVLQTKNVTVTSTVQARITLGGTAYASTFTYGGARTQDAVTWPCTRRGATGPRRRTPPGCRSRPLLRAATRP